MKLSSKTLPFLLGALALCLVLLTVHAKASDPTLVRIGYQKYGTLNVVRARGDLEKALNQQGKKVQWLLFSAGPQLLEALNAGSIDVGNTGEAPPIFAQAANPSLLYLGNQPPFPEGEALLVPKSSSVTSVAELKGKTVVNGAGQWATDQPPEVAAYLAKEVGMDPQILEPIIRREPWGFRPVDAKVIADQQAIADLFYSLKLIPKPIKVSEAVAGAPAKAAN